MKWYLDFFVGRAPMEVIGPPHRWEMAADWKLPAENFIGDSYHTVQSTARSRSSVWSPRSSLRRTAITSTRATVMASASVCRHLTRSSRLS